MMLAVLRKSTSLKRRSCWLMMLCLGHVVWMRRSFKLSLRLRFDGTNYFLQGLLARLDSSRLVCERTGELFRVLLHTFLNLVQPLPSK